MDNAAKEIDYVLTIPRKDQDSRGKIRCHPSGKYVNPLNLRASDIDIRDIAHHLSNICRYTGACPKFYSVAQHSVLVSRMLAEHGPAMALAGLLHDAAEYVFNDLASPVKHDPRMAWYSKIEHDATRMIFRVFGLDHELLPLTKPADNAIFKREVNTWWNPDFKEPISLWGPERAERIFLREFYRLSTRL